MNESSIINDYINGLPNKQILTKYGIWARALYRILRSNSTVLRGGRNKYGGDHHFFSQLNSERHWYWLGFIAADGHIKIKKRERRLSINLQLRDKSHLELLATHLGYGGPIATRQTFDVRYNKNYQSCRFQWASIQIVEDLLDFGINDIKRGKIEPLLRIPPDQYRHFLRGYFDGDGTIIFGGKVCPSWRWKLCSPHRQQLEYMMSGCPIVKRYNAIKTNKGIWVVQYNGRHITKSICEWLYADATVSLERKRIIADQCMS